MNCNNRRSIPFLPVFDLANQSITMVRYDKERMAIFLQLAKTKNQQKRHPNGKNGQMLPSHQTPNHGFHISRPLRAVLSDYRTHGTLYFKSGRCIFYIWELFDRAVSTPLGRWTCLHLMPLCANDN